MLQIIAMHHRSFLQFAIVITAAITALALFAQYSILDIAIENLFFDFASNNWPYRNLFITKDLLHTWAKNFVVLLAALNLIAYMASFRMNTIKPYRKHLLFLLIASATGPALVSALKSITHIYSPWDLQIYGGNMPHIRLFDPVPDGAPVGHGFPGGHSSGGFAYLSLFFLLTLLNHRLRWYGLIFPLSLGIVFSITQEIRGAHFLSHDLFSLLICWMSSFIWSMVFYPNRYRHAITALRPAGKANGDQES